MVSESFRKQVGNWVAETEKRSMAVLKQSAQDVVSRAQKSRDDGGRMPVVEGNLRNSLIVALNGSSVGKGKDSYINAIPLMKAGDELFIGWTAEYARRVEYGFQGADKLGRVYDQDGAGFFRGAVEKWPHFIMRNARRLRFRAMGKGAK